MPDTQRVRQGEDHKGNNPMKLSQMKKYRHFFSEKNEKWLDIRLIRGYYSVWKRDPYSAASAPELISLVISAKVYENQPSLSISSFAPVKKYQQGTIVSLYLAGRFFMRHRSRFLAGPSYTRMRNRPAFFMFRRGLARRNVNTPEVPHAPVRLSTVIILAFSAGNSHVRRGLFFSSVIKPLTLFLERQVKHE